MNFASNPAAFLDRAGPEAGAPSKNMRRFDASIGSIKPPHFPAAPVLKSGFRGLVGSGAYRFRAEMEPVLVLVPDGHPLVEHRVQLRHHKGGEE